MIYVSSTITSYNIVWYAIVSPSVLEVNSSISYTKAYK